MSGTDSGVDGRTDPRDALGAALEPLDEVGIEVGPDEVRGLLDGWTATGQTGDSTGEQTGILRNDSSADHARIASLAAAAALLRGLQVSDGVPGDWVWALEPAPLPIADGLPLPTEAAVVDEVTRVLQRPVWSGSDDRTGETTGPRRGGMETTRTGGLAHVTTAPAPDNNRGPVAEEPFFGHDERTLTRVVTEPVPADARGSSRERWLPWLAIFIAVALTTVLVSLGAVVYFTS